MSHIALLSPGGGEALCANQCPDACVPVAGHFVKLLRQLKLPVYRSTVIDYAMALLNGSPAARNFVKTDADGEPIPRDEVTGGYVWDIKKWHNWYYRRFLGQDGVHTGNQRLKDAKRDRWMTSDNLLVHYQNYSRACLEAGIFERDPEYDPNDLDEEGVPRKPQYRYVESKRGRVFSFDETKIKGDTHGDSGSRKAHAERIVLFGSRDDGETVGAKHSRRQMSAVGGSNGKFEGTPCFLVLAAETFEQAWLAGGPKTTVGGR